VAAGLSATPSITVGDLDFQLTYRKADQNGESRNYLLAGEEIGHYNRGLFVRVFKDQRDSEAYLREAAAMVKKGDPSARLEFVRSERTGELLLECLLVPSKLKQGFAEWSLMRAHLVEGVGFVAYHYVMRVYFPGEDIASRVEIERKKMLGHFSIATFEERAEPGAPGQGP